jgi:hypothetical protein
MVAFAHGWLGWRTRRRCVCTMRRRLAGCPRRAGTCTFAPGRTARITLSTIRTRIVAEIGAFAPAETTLALFATAFIATVFAACARATVVAALAAVFPVRTRRETELLAVGSAFAAAFATIFAVRTCSEAALGPLAAWARRIGPWR